MTDPAHPELSEDALLGRRVRFRQPRQGYRVAIDPVLLAAAVPAGPGDLVLDAGAGVGAAALCLAARVPGCRVVGVEVQRDLARLASDNVALNGVGDRVEIVVGDIAAPPPCLAPGTFDHIMVNPPYLEADKAVSPPHPGKARANVESTVDLEVWVRFALVMARAKGSLTFIHRADRMDTLLGALSGAAGDTVVFPLWPAAGQPAKRVLVRARKGIMAPMRLAPGLVLHEGGGRFTREAEAVLRDAQRLVL
jgi:tRNA1(Val) A37 N6-methylase TrmN6